jgi:hypothetical protein
MCSKKSCPRRDSASSQDQHLLAWEIPHDYAVRDISGRIQQDVIVRRRAS